MVNGDECPHCFGWWGVPGAPHLPELADVGSPQHYRVPPCPLVPNLEIFRARSLLSAISGYIRQINVGNGSCQELFQNIRNRATGAFTNQ
jgi:hypothetical protein